MKSLGDFSNTVYFLLFDRNVVASALDTAQRGNGLNYLEKIIQVPFELPTPKSQQVLDLVLKRMTSVIRDVEDAKWDARYWGNVLNSGFKLHFKNLRDADRFLSVFSFNFGLMGEELNLIDLAAITGLQVFHPKLFYGIKENRGIFLGERHRYGRGDEAERKRVKEECDAILKTTDRGLSEDIVGHLRVIFPQLDYYYGNTSHSGAESRWRKAGRICSAAHFDKFFNLSVPEGEIPRPDIEKLVSSAATEEQFRTTLVALGEKGLFRKSLDYLQDYTDEGIPEKDIPNVIKVVLEEGDEYVERYGNALFSFEFDTSSLILRIVHQLLKRFKTHQERMKVFFNSAKKASKGVYTIAHQVAVMGQEHGKYGGNQETLDLCTVEKADLAKLEKLAVQKIKKAASGDALLEHPKLSYLLVDWREWGNKKECDRFVKSTIKTNEGLIKILKAFTGKGYQTGMSDFASNVFYHADHKILVPWIPANELKKRLEGIQKAPDFSASDEESRRSVTAFLESLEGKGRW